MEPADEWMEFLVRIPWYVLVPNRRLLLLSMYQMLVSDSAVMVVHCYSNLMYHLHLLLLCLLLLDFLSLHRIHHGPMLQ